MSPKFRFYGWSGGTDYITIRIFRTIDDGDFADCLFRKKYFEAISEIGDLMVTNTQRFYFTEIQYNVNVLRPVYREQISQAFE
jgi:hypothetical protein